MSFLEKSAWVMCVALVLGGWFYFATVSNMSSSDQLAPPNIPVLVIYTVILIVVAIVGHTAIAIMAPKEANSSMDEREKRIFDRAGNLSSYLFGFGVIMSLGFYLLTRSGDILFYTVFASLMLAQLAEYLIAILLYRTSL